VKLMLIAAPGHRIVGTALYAFAQPYAR